MLKLRVYSGLRGLLRRGIQSAGSFEATVKNNFAVQIRSLLVEGWPRMDNDILTSGTNVKK